MIRGRTVQSLTCNMEEFKQFQQLARDWSLETGLLSFHDTKNLSHIKIVEMGQNAIPYILYDWSVSDAHIPKAKENLRHWFHALHAITKATPIPYEDRGKIARMKQHWIKYLTDSGYDAFVPVLDNQ